MFSREYYKVFKNTYFEEHMRTAASIQGMFKKEMRLAEENFASEYSNYLNT